MYVPATIWLRYCRRGVEQQSINQKPSVPEAEAESELDGIATNVPPSPSPIKERLPLSEVPVPNKPVPKKNMCQICHIVYKSEADIESHWVQCSQKGCGCLVHCRCIHLYYPPTSDGLKALNKWAKDRVFCQAHYQC